MTPLYVYFLIFGVVFGGLLLIVWMSPKEDKF